MTRRVRMILLAAFGPALLTVAFSVAVFGGLYLVGLRYTREQVETGIIFFFACGQIVAIWWLWTNLKNPHEDEEAGRKAK